MITVRASKYDGSRLRTWTAEVMRQEGSLLVLDGTFDTEIKHDLLGTIASGTRSTEYYWLDRWYNIFRFAQPNGELRGYYCNINTPPVLEDEILSYVDLDIDILVEPDLSYRVVDVEDFERNAASFEYSQELRADAQRALSDLIEMIESRKFPFDEVLEA